MTARGVMNGIGLAASVGLAGAFALRAVTPVPVTPGVVEPAGDFMIEPATADLGSARQRQTLTGRYAVVNRLPVAVDIEMVGRSCACAEAEVEPKTIEPGQSGTLSVAWRTGTKRGKVAERVTVVAVARDGTGVKLIRELVLQADVRPDYRIEPPELRFDAEIGGTAVLKLIPDAMPDARIIGASANDAGLLLTVDLSANMIVVKYESRNFKAPFPLAMTVVTNSRHEPDSRVAIKMLRFLYKDN